MLVVETLVALVEHSLLCEPTPVPAFQLVLNSVGAGPSTSRSAVADVLAESAAASIVRHISCVPPNVQPEAVLEELAVWADLGRPVGGGTGGDPRFTVGGPRWGSSIAATGGGSHSLMGFGLSRVVPLDPLVVFVAMAGGGSLEERTRAAFWTLDRDGVGYLTLEQLQHLSGLLVAVAAAGRVVLNQPPLPRSGGGGDTVPVPSSSGAACAQAALWPQQKQASPHPVAPAAAGPRPDVGGSPASADGGGSGMAAAIVPPPGTAAGGASAGAAGRADGGGDSGDDSRTLLGSSLVAAFQEHCLPAEGPGGLPARLTVDRLALVVQSAAAFITMAVVHRATTAHANLPSDSGYGQPYMAGGNHPHPYPHHYSGRKSFGAAHSGGGGGGHARLAVVASAGRSSAHGPHGLHHPHLHVHQRQHSSNATLLTVSTSAGMQVPVAAAAAAAAGPLRSQRSTVAVLAADGMVSNVYSPSASQQQLSVGQSVSYGGGAVAAAAAAGPAMTQAQNTEEASLERGDVGQVPCIDTNVRNSGGGGGGGGPALADIVSPFARAAAAMGGLISRSSGQRRGLAVGTTGLKAPGRPLGASASAPAAATTAGDVNAGEPTHSVLVTTASASARGWGWSWARVEPSAPPAAAAVAKGTSAVQKRPAAAAAGGGAPRQPTSWPGGGLWTAISYIGATIWGVGRAPATPPASGSNVAELPTIARPAAAEPHGEDSRTEATGSAAAAAAAALPRGAPAPAASLGNGSSANVTPTPTPNRGSPLGRVSEHPDLPDSPLHQSPIRLAVTTTAVGNDVAAGAAAGLTEARRSVSSPPVAGPGPPASGGGGVDAVRAASTDMSSALGTEVGPALLAAFAEAADRSTRGVGGSAGGGGGSGGGGAGGGGGGGGHPARAVSGLFNKWRRASRLVTSATSEAAGSAGHAAATSPGTSAAHSAGGAAFGGGTVPEQAAGRAGAAADEGGGVLAALVAANSSTGGAKRRMGILQGFVSTSGGGGAGGVGGGDGSVHGGGASAAAAAGTAAPPPQPAKRAAAAAAAGVAAAAGIDSHLLMASLALAPQSIEEAASRAEVAAKAEAAAAATRGGAAAVTAGGAGGAAGGREVAAAPTGAAHGPGVPAGGTVLPPLQRAIRSSVQQAGVKLFLHCGVCLLAIIALLLLDAALVAWIYLDRKQRLSRSLVIVAATNTGLVLLVLVISIVRSCMTDRAAALEAAAAARQQAARGGGAGGGGPGGGAGGVLGFLISNFVTPTLQTMGILRGPEEAVAGRAGGTGAPGHVLGGVGHHHHHHHHHHPGSGGGGGWGSRLRVLWATVGRLAGFDSAEGGAAAAVATAGAAGATVAGGHGGLPIGSGHMTAPRFDYLGPQTAMDLEAGGGASRTAVGGSIAVGAGGGGSAALGSGPYSPDGQMLASGVAGSPFVAVTLGGPDTGTMVGGADATSAGAGGGGASAAGDPRVGKGYPVTGTAARERTRGSALPGTYYSSVPTMQRVEAAYPNL